MSLIALTEKKEIKNAFNTLSETLTVGIKPIRQKLGWRGKGQEFDLYWNAANNFWAVLDSELTHNRYWCAFGTSSPEILKTHSIVCEINPPYKGMDKRAAGRFAKDISGAIYITHSGRVGGGRPGIGQGAFLPFYGSDTIQDINWPRGKDSESIVIGRIDSKYLPLHLSRFIRKVEEFKLYASEIPLHTHNYSPEFSGKRKSYTSTSKIESKCFHGVIVDELYDLLKSKGYQPYNNDQRDLYLLNKKGVVTHLFEVKSNKSTTSIYTGIGQLMFYGAIDNILPKRFLVLPDDVDERTLSALKKIGIDVISFGWKNDKPKFYGLKKHGLLKKHRKRVQ